MTERTLLINDLTIQYEGLFSAEDFFKLVEDWFYQNGYDKNEYRHVERVKEKGKYVELELRPDKTISEYVKYEIYVTIRISDLVNTEAKKGDKKFKINKGNISMAINAFIATDRKGMWESRPMTFFMRTLFDKFLLKKYINQYEEGLRKDVQNFHAEMKSYFNLQRYNVPS